MSEGPATKARGLFDEFLKEHDICNAEAGRQLDVSAPTILHWRRGDKRPEDFQRAKIERWTEGWSKGPILSQWWRTKQEARALSGIRPCQAIDGGPRRPRVASPASEAGEKQVA